MAAGKSTTSTSSGGKVVVSARVSADDRDWLRAQAAREQRDAGVVLGRAIALYRQACAASGFDDETVAAAMPPLAALTGDGAPRQLTSGTTP